MRQCSSYSLRQSCHFQIGTKSRRKSERGRAVRKKEQEEIKESISCHVPDWKYDNHLRNMTVFEVTKWKISGYCEHILAWHFFHSQ